MGSKELDRLVAKVGPGHSVWDDADVDVYAAARRARADHAAETLLQLGHDHLAAELLRLERNNRRHPSSVSGFPPAA